MNKYFHFILLFFIIQVSISQTECVGNFAGIYPCNDYDLMSHMDISTFGSNLEANDSWGWTDSTTQKEYVIMGVTDGTVFVDVTNPLSLIYLGKLPTATTNSLWRDIKVYQDHAFIVSEANGHGMQVFDLTKLRTVASPPQTFTADAHYTDFGSAHNIVINEDTGFAYAVGADYSGGAHFINIQNPTNPIAAGGYAGSGYTHDAQVVTYNGPDTQYVGSEIFFGSNEDEVVIVDVSNKNSPTLISSLSYTGVGYTHQGWLTEDHTYFLLGDEFDERNNGHDTRTYIFNFSDLNAPTYQATYENTGNLAIDHNGYVLGNKFYLASYRAGLRVLDISNINAANEIGYFDTYPTNNNANFNGAWSVYPYFASENIIISDIEKGLFVVRKNNTLNINSVSQDNTFTITPNPSINNPIVKSNSSNPLKTISVFNILGQEVFTKDNIDSKTFVIPTQNLSKGVYLVKINNLITKKIILN